MDVGTWDFGLLGSPYLQERARAGLAWARSLSFPYFVSASFSVSRPIAVP
jgi:hypothetical protein